MITVSPNPVIDSCSPVRARAQYQLSNSKIGPPFAAFERLSRRLRDTYESRCTRGKEVTELPCASLTMGGCMTGFTLSPEQIRSAPTEVRRWIEHEIATSLGLQAQAGESQPKIPQLANCSRDELIAVLPIIQGVFLAVNVFFELGRKGSSFAQGRLEAYRLSDIQHHTRLQSVEQVLSCLAIIDDALHRVIGSTDVSFYGIDGDYCFIATETQQNIGRLWFELLDRGEHASPPSANGDVLSSQGSAAPVVDRVTVPRNAGMQSLQS